MAEFLKKVLSLSAAGDVPSIGTVTVSSSARQIPSDQTTKFDQQSDTPIVAPLDTLEEVRIASRLSGEKGPPKTLPDQWHRLCGMQGTSILNIDRSRKMDPLPAAVWKLCSLTT